jgi:hypothetical protein
MYNGSGTFSLVAGNPVVTGTTISSTWANNTLSDIASNGLTYALTKDGQTTPTANIPMGSFKLTGLGAGTSLTDSATLQQVQYGFGSFLTSVAGTNTITATATPTPAYAVGQRFTFVPAVTNTGATTLNISSVGAGAIQLDGAALIGGELEAGRAVTVYVTAATPVFEIIGPSPATGTVASTFTFNGSGGTSGSVTITYQKVGKFVTLHIPVATATTGTGSTGFFADTALPAAIRPPSATQVCASNNDLDNGGSTSTPSVALIATDGIITILRSPAAQAWTNSATGGMIYGMTLTYFVG